MGYVELVDLIKREAEVERNVQGVVVALHSKVGDYSLEREPGSERVWGWYYLTLCIATLY